LVMALGIGLAFSNARAVLEALLRIKTEFIRTPKYKVEGDGDATWKRKKYGRKRGWLPLFELGFAAYFVLAISYAAHMGMWGTIPFLSLFCFGYGYMGLMSLLQAGGVKRWLELLRPLAFGRR
ncbi:MAG: glycosyl transferase family 2, partial [Acidobacteria bacterium]|nr:glycosyl transferase family 2 [Acidobacteriota bacterium]